MITRIDLLRNADTVFGTFGYLDLYDGPTWVDRFCTGEDDWLDNRPSVSCIAAGEYTAVRTVWHKTRTETFEITGVPGRSRILFHWGNTEENVEGCVLTGRRFGALTVPDEDAPGKPMTLKWGIAAPSLTAFREFMARMIGVDRVPISVRWAAPGSWRS